MSNVQPSRLLAKIINGQVCGIWAPCVKNKKRFGSIDDDVIDANSLAVTLVVFLSLQVPMVTVSYCCVTYVTVALAMIFQDPKQLWLKVHNLLKNDQNVMKLSQTKK